MNKKRHLHTKQNRKKPKTSNMYMYTYFRQLPAKKPVVITVNQQRPDPAISVRKLKEISLSSPNHSVVKIPTILKENTISLQ